jgi:hypothetical protein
VSPPAAASPSPSVCAARTQAAPMRTRRAALCRPTPPGEARKRVTHAWQRQRGARVAARRRTRNRTKPRTHALQLCRRSAEGRRAGAAVFCGSRGVVRRARLDDELALASRGRNATAGPRPGSEGMRQPEGSVQLATPRTRSRTS